MNNAEYRNTLYEVSEVFGALDQKLMNKLPKELVEKIIANKAEKHSFKMDYKKPLKEQNFMKTTKEFLAGLYLTYWADEKEKNSMKKRMLENEKRQLENFERNYKENIFASSNQVTANEVKSVPVADDFVMIEVEEDGFFKKLWSRFLNLFSK